MELVMTTTPTLSGFLVLDLLTRVSRSIWTILLAEKRHIFLSILEIRIYRELCYCGNRKPLYTSFVGEELIAQSTYARK